MLHKKFLFIIWAFSFLIIPPAYAGGPVVGCIALYENGIPKLSEVVLPAFQGGVLKNSLIELHMISEVMVPDSKGRYCYGLKDDRLAYVQMYYFATRMISEYNGILNQLGIRPIESLAIMMAKDNTKCGGGDEAQEDGIHATFNSPALDYTTIAHEVGHMIHRHLIGNISSRENPTSGSSAEKSGIIEGTANILAALHLDQSRISGLDLNLDVMPDVDQFIKYPFGAEVNTRRSMEKLLRVLNSKGPQCSIDANEISYLLNNTAIEIRAFLDSSDPYRASAIINQPLWQAQKVFGKEVIQKLYVSTLFNLKNYGFYSDLSSLLTKTAGSQNEKLKLYLEKAYLDRGLINQLK
jgi:hypothetical protein